MKSTFTTDTHTNKVSWFVFLLDVLMCALGSYGGPEAHYGIFLSILVHKKKYISEEELTEMIGVYALIPGPSSSQTITAIGYVVGGPLLAFLTFLVWAFPAILIMSTVGVFFSFMNANDAWKPLLTYLPSIAVAYILFASFKLSTRTIKNNMDFGLFGFILMTAFLTLHVSIWMVPVLLVTGGILYMIPHRQDVQTPIEKLQPRWWILLVVVGIAILNESLRMFVHSTWITLFTSFYRYGYSVIGGGQIVIPLMIQDLVQSQSVITLQDFLSGYAIDQAIPGPLFSFASFVSARIFAGSDVAFLAGLFGGLSIFLPGILLVYFVFPIWQRTRKIPFIKHFLKGVTLTAASLILYTGITSMIQLPIDWITYGMVGLIFILLMTKKVPEPLMVLGVALLGFLI